VSARPGPPQGHRQTLLALQGLRGAAALLVVIDHAMLTFAKYTGLPVDEPLALAFGQLGVCTFFVISGFVMVVSHAGDFGQGRSTRFALRRLGRVLPLYYLATALVALALAARGEAPSAASLLQSALFVPHDAGREEFGHPVYGLGWTLQYEMLFYAVFAAAMLLPLRAGMAAIAAVFGGWVALASTGALDGSPALAYFGRPIVLYFLLGIALGLARPHVARLLPARPGFGLALGVSLVALAAALPSAASGNPAAWAVPLACALACAACMWADESAPARGVAARAWRRVASELGDATYAIYLSHSFLLGPLGRVARQWWPSMPLELFVALSLAGSTVLGIAVHRRIEKPMLLAWQRATRRTPDAGPVAQAAATAGPAARG
jgi:exopolysaccharide production protein ExoZ